MTQLTDRERLARIIDKYVFERDNANPAWESRDRQWLARQLLDAKLTDAEAYSVVAFAPKVKDQWKPAQPTADIEEAFDDAARARDEAGFLGTPAQCIRYLDAEVRALAAGAPAQPTADVAWASIPIGKRFGRYLTADAVEHIKRGTLLRFHSEDPWFEHGEHMPSYGEIVVFTGNVDNTRPLVGPHLEVASLGGHTFPGGGWVHGLFQFVSDPQPTADVAGVVEALREIASFSRMKPGGDAGSYQRGYDIGFNNAGLVAAGIAQAALAAYEAHRGDKT